MTDPLKTDKGIYAEPPLPMLPQAGGTLTDPTFGTTILRVTDERDGVSCTNAYSYWPSLNCDNTRLFYMRDGEGTICDFDAANMQISNKRPLWIKPLPGGGQLNTEDAIWGGAGPDIIYGHAGMKVWGYNVKTGDYNLVVDLTGKVGGAANLQQMTKSLDDRAFGFNITLGDSGGWQRVGYITWRKRTDGVADLFVRITSDIDEVQLDKTGQYLVVLTGKQGAGVIETRVVNLDTRAVTDLTDDGPDFAPGHKDCGRGTVTGEDNWRNGVTFRRLDSPHQHITILNSGNDWSQGRHISTLADDESMALISAYIVPSNRPAAGPFHNELFMVSTDGKESVRRICHHRSTLFQYWDSPRADISRDGRFAVFTSDWGSTARRDVFVVRIPPVASTPPPPAPVTLFTVAKDGADAVILDASGKVIGRVKL